MQMHQLQEVERIKSDASLLRWWSSRSIQMCSDSYRLQTLDLATTSNHSLHVRALAAVVRP